VSFFAARPPKDTTADRLKLAHTEKGTLRDWLVARAHSLSRHAEAPRYRTWCKKGHLHAQRIISFMHNPGVKRQGYVLK
jgi:hypothetical protein